ncbi:MAG: hypothetical protein H6Q12_1163, partial [Bacteroidetes bacterium]|nr:hypothetical protein [Bacteroidota bacterium]
MKRYCLILLSLFVSSVLMAGKHAGIAEF